MKRLGSILLVASLAALGLAGCAHKGSSDTTTASTAPAQAAPATTQKTPATTQKTPATTQKAPATTQKTPPAEAAKPVKGAPAPAGSKLAKVQKDMTPDQVREIMGAPTREKSYVTAKAFIPYYYGADAGTNTEWAYKGVGRVVFGVNKYTHVTRVIRIDYDPSETGQ